MAVASKMDEIRELTNLQAFDIAAILGFFMDQATGEGYLTHESFYRCFEVLVRRNLEGRPDASVDPEHLTALIDYLFDLFDADGNGIVDISELSAGISVLCGGSRDDKVLTSLALFDEDGDGFVSLGELSKYLASVFKVLFASNPQASESMGVTPPTLATITSKQCFDDAGLAYNARISFAAFQEWYTSSSFGAAPESDVEGEAETTADVASLSDISAVTNLGSTPVVG